VFHQIILDLLAAVRTQTEISGSNRPLNMRKVLDREGGSQNATLVVVLPLLVLGISSVKIPKAFLVRSGAQRNFARTLLLTFATDVLSQIFKLISN